MRNGFWQIVLLLLLCSVAHAQPGKVTYVYTDPQGTPLAEADASGNITATFDYRPYGSIALGTAPTGPGYTGHVNDPDVGLVYMQARYYDLVVGRFISIDPVGPSQGNVSNFNRFTYTNNNPVNHIDPDGRQVAPGDDGPVAIAARTGGTINPDTAMEAGKTVVSLVPVAGDAVNIIDAIADPTPVNISGAVIGLIPEIGGGLAKGLKAGAAGGERAGKAFTRAGKAEVKAENAAKNGGKTVCEHCGRDTIPGQQSQKGVTPPGNETHVDHVVPKAKGGDGAPANGQVLCRDCNLNKGAKVE